MLYKEITLAGTDAEDRLWRRMYVKQNISLKEMGCLFLTSLRSEIDHPFLFEAGGKNYVSSAFTNDPDENSLVMDDYKLSDIPEEFMFLYDTGQGWYFRCTVSDGTYSFTKKPAGILTAGQGAGIFEGDRASYVSYISGKADPSGEGGPGNDICLPVNLEIDTFGEFDRPLDITEEQEYISDFARLQFSQFKEDEREWFDGEEELYHYPVWNGFAKADYAASARSQTGESAEYWLKAFSEFRNVCVKLTEAGGLPAHFDGLYPLIGNGWLLRSLIMDMPEALSAEGEYGACLSVCMELYGMFEYERDDLDILAMAITESLMETGEFERAEGFVETWAEDSHGSLNAYAMKIQLLGIAGKYEEADELAEKLMEDNPVCETENVGLYIAAAQLAEKMGDHKYSRTLLEQVTALITDVMFPEGDDEGFDDDDDDLYFPEDDEEVTDHYDLYAAVKIFKEERGPVNLMKVCEEFHDLVEENAPVFVSGFPNDDGTGRMTVYDTDDGLQLLSIYSCDRACEEAADETEVVVGLQDLVIQALSSGIDGISIDSDTDQMRMVIFSEILREILKDLGIPDPAVYS